MPTILLFPVEIKIKHMSEFIVFDDIGVLDQESRYLIHKAKDAADHAYAPYSKFHVGAALLLTDGTLVTGSNQENASYPLCMCGERVALYAAVSQHHAMVVTRLAVVAFRKGHKAFVEATPCGACRQVMFEFEERQKKPFKVVLFGPGQKWYEFPSAASLLPLAFDKGSLSR